MSENVFMGAVCGSVFDMNYYELDNDAPWYADMTEQDWEEYHTNEGWSDYDEYDRD